MLEDLDGDCVVVDGVMLLSWEYQFFHLGRLGSLLRLLGGNLSLWPMFHVCVPIPVPFVSVYVALWCQWYWDHKCRVWLLEPMSGLSDGCTRLRLWFWLVVSPYSSPVGLRDQSYVMSSSSLARSDASFLRFSCCFLLDNREAWWKTRTGLCHRLCSWRFWWSTAWFSLLTA
jgi:hypothetical protein